jgi:hypothetical protein
MAVAVGKLPQIACPRCSRSIRLEPGEGSATCRPCRQDFIYLRLDPRPEPGPLPLPASAGGAACAKHARNAAVASCDRCGAFACELCRIASDGRTLCPGCFDRLAAGGELASIRTLIRNDGGPALLCGIVAVIFPFFGLLFAPVALWAGLRGRAAERSMGERLFGWRLWVGIIGGGLSILLYGGGLIVLLISKAVS